MTSKPIVWKQYQEDCANLFRSLGYSAEVEAKLPGARARHSIDVLVTLSVGGIRTKWIVECKRWRTKVKKEQVMALSQIAQDIGADHAFLLSEVGFQAGAIASTRHTNITLASISELAEAAKEDIKKIEISNIFKRNAEFERRLRDMLYDENGRFYTFWWVSGHIDEVTTLLGGCFGIWLALTKAILGEYPVICSSIIDDEQSAAHSNSDSLLRHLTSATAHIEGRVIAIEKIANNAKQHIIDDTTRITDEILILLNLSEESFRVDIGDTKTLDDRRRLCLLSMQRIGGLADTLRHRLRHAPSRELKILMRLLIDTVYLELTRSKAPKKWDAIRSAAEAQCQRFRTSIDAEAKHIK